MEHICRDDVSRALDILAQRITAISLAKGKKGGSWEKAEAIELVGGGQSSALASSSLMQLGS